MMFRYLNPIRIFRSKQTVHPTESLLSDPTPSPSKPRSRLRLPNAHTQIPEPPGTGSLHLAKLRGKRIRFADQKPSENVEGGGGWSESSPASIDGQMMIRLRKRAKTTTTTTSVEKLRLKSSDGEIFDVNGEMMVASSERIKALVRGSGYCSGEVIVVPEVAGDVMAIVIEYCKKRAEEGGVDEEKEKKWAEELFRADQSTFFDLTLAAYHLKIERLMDLTCKTVADMIRGKSPTEINKILKIQGGDAAALLPPSNELGAK